MHRCFESAKIKKKLINDKKDAADIDKTRQYLFVTTTDISKQKSA